MSMPTWGFATNTYGQQTGAPVQGGGGGGGDSTMGSLRRLAPGCIPQPFFRDDLDFERSMFRRIPSAEYPDGFLGTIRSRRDDRLLRDIQSRVNQRSYQRGVHKGERIDPQDYFWPKDWNPQTGLQCEAMGSKLMLAESLYPRAAATERQMVPRGSQSLLTVSPERVQQLRNLRPDWS